jgi:hypothetical protein
MGPSSGPKSATTVQFTTSTSQNSSPDSCPRLPVHAGTLSAFSLWLRILKMSVSLLPSNFPSYLLSYPSSLLPFQQDLLSSFLLRIPTAARAELCIP